MPVVAACSPRAAMCMSVALRERTNLAHRIIGGCEDESMTEDPRTRNLAPHSHACTAPTLLALCQHADSNQHSRCSREDPRRAGGPCGFARQIDAGILA